MIAKTSLLLASTLLTAFSFAPSGAPSATPASGAFQPAADLPGTGIERLDPALDELIPATAHVESVASGFKWTEGPVWTRQGFLLFAEIPSNSIRKLAPDGQVGIFLQPTGYQGAAPYGGPEPGTNGMTLDHSGRLTIAGHAARNIWRLESTGSTLDPRAPKTILADAFNGQPLNSPNDLVYRSDGSLYFTDPPYGLRTQGDNDPEKRQPVNGVYLIPHAQAIKPGTPPDNSKVQLLIQDLSRPNGIAFSPDEKFLYVNNTGPKKLWMRYPVHKDGTLGPGEVFFDASSDPRRGAPDGMKVDRHGNVYSAGPGGIWIFSPAGKHLGTILLPASCGNLAWGDADAKTLYLTDSSQILRIHVNIPGLRP